MKYHWMICVQLSEGPTTAEVPKTRRTGGFVPGREENCSSCENVSQDTARTDKDERNIRNSRFEEEFDDLFGTRENGAKIAEDGGEHTYKCDEIEIESPQILKPGFHEIG